MIDKPLPGLRRAITKMWKILVDGTIFGSLIFVANSHLQKAIRKEGLNDLQIMVTLVGCGFQLPLWIADPDDDMMRWWWTKTEGNDAMPCLPASHSAEIGWRSPVQSLQVLPFMEDSFVHWASRGSVIKSLRDRFVGAIEKVSQFQLFSQIFFFLNRNKIRAFSCIVSVILGPLFIS